MLINKYKYTGQWRFGKKHGQGSAKYISGATYTGKFWNNLYHGKGEYITPSGEAYQLFFNQGTLISYTLKNDVVGIAE